MGRVLRKHPHELVANGGRGPRQHLGVPPGELLTQGHQPLGLVDIEIGSLAGVLGDIE
jgi:hypothetical protein